MSVKQQHLVNLTGASKSLGLSISTVIRTIEQGGLINRIKEVQRGTPIEDRLNHYKRVQVDIDELRYYKELCSVPPPLQRGRRRKHALWIRTAEDRGYAQRIIRRSRRDPEIPLPPGRRMKEIRFSYACCMWIAFKEFCTEYINFLDKLRQESIDDYMQAFEVQKCDVPAGEHYKIDMLILEVGSALMNTLLEDFYNEILIQHPSNCIPFYDQDVKFHRVMLGGVLICRMTIGTYSGGSLQFDDRIGFREIHVQFVLVPGDPDGLCIFSQVPAIFGWDDSLGELFCAYAGGLTVLPEGAFTTERGRKSGFAPKKASS